MMDCVLSGSLLVVFSLFCYAMCFFRANKLSLSLSLTKRLRGLSTLTYKDTLQVLGLQSLESRRLQFDLIYAYKILTGRI